MTYKFRGKRIDNGEWEYGFYSILFYNGIRDSEGKPKPGHYILNEGSGQDWSNTKFTEVHPDSVGMWTGKTDKNGVKLFRGDIYKIMMVHGMCGSPDVFRTEVVDQDCGCFLFPSGYVSLDGVNQAEVIGNTTDNPELVEG